MIPTREQIVSWSNMAVAWSYEKGVVANLRGGG